MRAAWILAAVGGLSLGLAEPVWSQNRTSTGLFGTTTQGGSAATRTSAASSNARTSTGTSAGGVTSSTTGGTGSGTSNTQNVAQMAQQNMVTNAAQPTQQRGAFVGADSSDTSNVRSLVGITGGAAGQRGNTGLNQLQNLFSQGLQQLNQQNQRSARPQIRTPLRMGFAPQPVSMTHVGKFKSHLTKLPGIHFVGTPELVLEGRTAVLRGKVASEDDRRLAEALAMMEPEVLAVRNELQVDSSATTGATPAAEELPAANRP